MVTSSKKIDFFPKIIPIILSGGKGSRLWPLSRECFPKQYLNLDENSNLTLLQNTYKRLIGIKNLENPIIICNEEQRFIVAEQMRSIKANTKDIILEPIGRNTAPAIALAALHATKNNNDPNLLVLSADHIIKKANLFRETIDRGISLSEKGNLVTFGVVPNRPETEFGYIEAFDELSKNNKSSKIKRFIEKPSLDTAKKFIENKCFTWNSGIFLFKASVILRELKKYHPELVDYCYQSLEKSTKDLDFIRIDENTFEKCQNISLDVAVMEKTNLGTVIPLNVGWSDIGNWNALWKQSIKDKNGNKLSGKAIIKDSKNCLFRSESRLIVGIGLENLVVVETDDAILISKREFTQNVKKIVSELDKKNYPEGKFNRTIFRPWGSYTSIMECPDWKIKKLEIRPGGSLSLQMHKHRSEHWVVVNGKAKVELEKNIFEVLKNENVYIPFGAKHRLSNCEDSPLTIIEVQSGSYLGEDDIIRFDDLYGRANK